MTDSSSTYSSHPCFGATARKDVNRLHLPVAPRANYRIRYSPVGKIQEAIQPEAALNWLDDVIAEGREIGVVGITGPGDPLVIPELTFRTSELVKEKYPNINLCITTLGFGADVHAENLAKLGISHVTILVDTVDENIAEELYAWIRPSKKNLPISVAAPQLIIEQAKAVKAFKAAGLTVKINTTVYPENLSNIEEIAKTMKELGADIMAITPFKPVEEDQAAIVVMPDSSMIATVRELASQHMELMPEWEECGSLVKTEEVNNTLPKPTKERPNVAAVSSNGMDVDMHLGQATRILIYGPREDGLACLLETRMAPQTGGGSSRWEELSELLKDCFILLTASAGDNPKKILGQNGLRVEITDESVEGMVDAIYGGGKKKKCKK